MAELDLARLVVRHRHVAPMLSALLTGTNAGCRISAADGTVIVEREGPGIGFERFPITVEGEAVGWVEGDRTARAIAAVLSYAVAREADKRSLAREALDRYRELNLVYELADRLSGEHDLAAVAEILVGEASKLPAGGAGFLLVGDDHLRPVGGGEVGAAFEGVHVGEGIVGGVAGSGVAEEVNDVVGNARSITAERAFASLIAAPVVARGRTLGVLGAASPTAVVYQAADLKLLSAIAAIAGPAVVGARGVDEAPAGTVGGTPVG
ncbi:MAG TPA: GAF domain-containing protein [Candidatus Limnocylindrales bacterium]|nr:GAF domain-containing protein [Candidatus Limnocylindrales bacterium]